MNAEKLNIEKIILMIRQKYFFWRVNLESEERGEPQGFCLLSDKQLEIKRTHGLEYTSIS